MTLYLGTECHPYGLNHMANKVITGIAWTTISSLARNFVSFIQIAVLTRFLDKASFGIVAIAGLFVSFTSLFMDMGISAGILYRQSISKKEYSSLFWLNILTGFLLTAILFLLSPFLTASYNSQELETVVKWLCFSVFISAIGNQQRVVCQKLLFFKRLAIIEIISSLITFIVAVVTAAKGFGVMSLAYSTLAGTLFNNCAHLIIGIIKDNRILIHFRFKETLPFLKIGVYSVGSQILDFFSRELDIIIVSSTLGLEFTGLYNIAKRIPIAIYRFVSPLLSRVFTPVFAKINRDKEKVTSQYLRLSHFMASFGFVIFFVIAALSPCIMDIVFGHDYIDGAIILSVFCIMYAFNSFMGVCGTLQVSMGRTDIGLYWTIFEIVSTGVIYYFSSLFGIYWFLAGILIKVLIEVVAIWYIQFRPILSIKFWDYYNSFKCPMLLCGIPCLLIGILCYNVPNLYQIIAGVFLGCFIVFLLLRYDEPFWVDLVDSYGLQSVGKIIIKIAAS